MLNRQMQTSRFTRNRDYHIRTYHVIPLEEEGGLIEWVPHMRTINDCIANGKCLNVEEFRRIRKIIAEVWE